MYEGFGDFWRNRDFCLTKLRPKPGTGYMKAEAGIEGEAGVFRGSQKISEGLRGSPKDLLRSPFRFAGNHQILRTRLHSGELQIVSVSPKLRRMKTCTKDLVISGETEISVLRSCGPSLVLGI
jgi:hypothetical protein